MCDDNVHTVRTCTQTSIGTWTSVSLFFRGQPDFQVLERDSVNMELRFDLEARSAETERLKRRAKELQGALRSQGVGSGGGGATKDAATSRPAGGRFKRERFVFFCGQRHVSLALDVCARLCVQNR